VKSEDKQFIKKMFDEIDLNLDGKTIYQWSFAPSETRSPDWRYIKRCYQFILDLDPNNVKALAGMANVLNDIEKDYGDALPYHWRVVGLEPNDFQHQYDMAVSLFNNDFPRGEIKRHLLLAIKSRPDWFANGDDLEIETDFIDKYISFEERAEIYNHFRSKAKTISPWFLLAAITGAGLNQFFSPPLPMNAPKERTNNL
jgi:tetratricopeptide (TPR) repeat protein